MAEQNDIIEKYAGYSRDFFAMHKVYIYRMKKIQDMDDNEVN